MLYISEKGTVAKSISLIYIFPAEGVSSLFRSFKIVDLPAPEGPIKKTKSPFSISKSTLSSTASSS
jgi:hypothetical protein